jgi:hypothetical protein
MKATRETLAQFLAKLGLTEQRLKLLTGILIKRLRVIFQDGNATDDEFIKLVQALSTRPAINFLCASQVGMVNQNGTGNVQTVIYNVFMKRLASLLGPIPSRVLPAQPVLINAIQQQASSQLPGGQVTPVSGGFAPAGPWALVA